MNIHIIVSKLIKEDGVFYIGGIETYVRQLAKALGEKYIVCIYQPSNKELRYEFEGYSIVGIKNSTCQDIVNYLDASINESDLIVISSEQLNIITKRKRTLVIQHGIYWDLPIKLYARNYWSKILPNIYKLFDNYRNYSRMKSYCNIVCVDYIYPIWLNTILGVRTTKKCIWVIPNHADDDFFNYEKSADRKIVKILFARRYMNLRGAIEFVKVSSEILKNHMNVEIVLSGEGPEEENMKEILPASSRVKYTKVDYSEMPELVHSSDIVVVPSIGSEGTSLSAIEAMAAGVPVVASSVGGLTNIIINNYNGILVQPGDMKELYCALSDLISNSKKRKYLGENGREVSYACFSFDSWKNQWINAIQHFD